MHRIIKIIVPLILLTMTAGCGVKITYKFTGASIPVEAKTISVTTFQNREAMWYPDWHRPLPMLLSICAGRRPILTWYHRGAI